jgi:hypothetical protein
MTSITHSLLITTAGAAGGRANSIQTGERNILPRHEEDLKVRRTGWIGNIIVGATASLVVWAVYSPLANFDLNNGDLSKTVLPLFQLGSSVIVGISGGKIMMSMAQQKADKIARDNFAELSKLGKTKKQECGCLDMSELEQTKERLDEIPGRIPASGSFEAARLSKEVLKLGNRLVQVCSPTEAANDSAAILHQKPENQAN